MGKFFLTSIWVLIALIGIWLVLAGLLYIPVFLPVGIFLCLLSGRLILLSIEKVRKIYSSF